MSYNPAYLKDDDNGKQDKWQPTPGRYRFKIDEVEDGETGPNSAEPGAPKKVFKLLVDAGAPWGDSKAFEHVKTEGLEDKKNNQLWKVKQICEAVGLDFDKGCENFEFVNKTGEADFVVDEWKGYINLKVDRYIAKDKGPAPTIIDDDDVPF